MAKILWTGTQTYWEAPPVTANPKRIESPSLVYDRGATGLVGALVLKGMSNIQTLILQTWDQGKNDAGDWMPDNAFATEWRTGGTSEFTVPINAEARYIRITIREYTGKPRIARLPKVREVIKEIRLPTAYLERLMPLTSHYLRCQSGERLPATDTVQAQAPAAVGGGSTRACAAIRSASVPR